MKDLGHTDYIIFVHRLASSAQIGEMDGAYSAWSTRAARFRRCRRGGTPPPRAGARSCHKSAALAKVADTLVEVYLGGMPAGGCSRGRIQRGVADRIEAALWFSDLRSFTTITDTAPPGEIIPLLNDYAEVVITAIYEAGGDVLKLIGDGTHGAVPGRRPVRGLPPRAQGRRARAGAREGAEREAPRRGTTTTRSIPACISRIFYGNIGSVERLDFTVVGPAVNETSRIASMCRSVDRRAGLLDLRRLFARRERARLVSVGRFALRASARPRTLHARPRDALTSNWRRFDQRSRGKIPRTDLRRLLPDASMTVINQAVQRGGSPGRTRWPRPSRRSVLKLAAALPPFR